MESLLDQGLAVLMGFSLAAVCGLRAFLPLFAISLLAMLGKVETGQSFHWMGSWPALLTFGTAVVLETAADKIPVLDHILDSAGLFIKPVAAALAMAGMIKDFDPLLALVISLLSGGLVAEGLALLKAKLRLWSTALSGTLANPVLSIAEDVTAFVSIVLVWILPVAGLLFLVLIVAIFFLRIRLKRKAATDQAKR